VENPCCAPAAVFDAALQPGHSRAPPAQEPAHLRTALTQVSLSIPVVAGRMALGTWQGIYLFEHRRGSHRRQVVGHVIGA